MQGLMICVIFKSGHQSQFYTTLQLQSPLKFALFSRLTLTDYVPQKVKIIIKYQSFFHKKESLFSISLNRKQRTQALNFIDLVTIG
jgi:hypothetical protein